MSKAKKGAFDGLLDEQESGFAAMLATATIEDSDTVVNLDDIEIGPQERTEFEDDEQTLAELGKSLRKRQLQAIGITPQVDRPKPYLLVWGERRIRGGRIEGLTELRARVVHGLSADDVAEIRKVENIHRKNLTQLEEARGIKKDVDELGMAGAMEKLGKSNAWFSKRLALLSLPEQANRLVTERISADPEVITQVATIEKRDKQAAAALVDDLKATRGKANARDKVAAVKETVKPSKKKAGKTDAAPSRSNTEGSMATARDTKQQEPGNVVAWPYPSAAQSSQSSEQDDDADGESAGGSPAPTAFAPAEVLTRAYIEIFEKRKEAKKVLASFTDDEREQVVNWLRPFYEVGVKCATVSHTVAQNMRKGLFATDNEGWFAMAAFLEGVAADTNFELLNILGSAKE
ncbi:ParB/RepB/Spo0J family partition protein [Burkholderia sp. Ac-20345]|uniref:ParB/RepB/Spo0J family partition protein n=1 Tax=Burkholderia sp. Ac-20345 TaxID=2703891 RepID=UPI00197BACE8|nr:ParB/RepB/Spo0J family partition protein [Burkholderia sp. Ac-20345]MBN3780501.1 ParB/RepB/Spo0J family partition protein [Burkholderia sp. Ac-20345]